MVRIKKRSTETKENEAIKNFIRKYYKRASETKIGNCNKVSRQVVMAYHEYYDNYMEFMKYANVIYYFLCSISDIDKGINKRWLNIMMSVKKQKRFFAIIKDICKKIPITAEDGKYILLSFKKGNERFTYLYENVMPEYLNITPAYSYIKKLHAKGIDFRDDLRENLDFEMENFFYENEPLKAYCEKIKADNGDKEWEENLRLYHQSLDNRGAIYDKYKAEGRERKKEDKAHKSQSFLDNYSRAFARNFNNAGLKKEGWYTSGIGVQTHEFSKRGEKCKVVLLMSSGSSRKEAVKFFCKDREGYMSGVRNATVIGEFEELPDSILERITAKQLVYTEIMVN